MDSKENAKTSIRRACCSITPQMKRFGVLALLALLTVGGCESLPRDARRSTERIQESRLLTIGVSSVEADPQVAQRERRILAAVAKRLGARVRYEKGNAHELLERLEKGELPIVAAQLPTDTPFAGSIGISQPFYEGEKKYSLAVAPGENRLLLIVDQVVREEKTEESG
jgi:hypothetical protein